VGAMSSSVDAENEHRMRQFAMGGQETGTSRLTRKFKEEPFVPVGTCLGNVIRAVVGVAPFALPSVNSATPTVAAAHVFTGFL